MTVIVAGGGITGLAAAYELARAGVAVELVEASTHLGGKVRTVREDGFLIEDGPDSFIAYRPAAAHLARELGMGDQLIGTTEPRRVDIRTRGRFVPMPDGMGLVLPTKMMPFVRTPLFSPAEKLGMVRDLLLPRSDPSAEVSIGAFLRRRFGQPMIDRLADPLIGGIYGAPVDELSLDAVVPQLRESERDHRSLLLASLAQGRARRAAAAAAQRPAPGVPTPRPSMFLSLRDGMGSLVRALTEALAANPRVRLRLGVGIVAVERRPGGVVARLADGSTVAAEAMILATSASVSADAITGFAPSASAALRTIPHGSTAVVSLGYRLEQFGTPPDGHGFLVAGDEPLSFGAATWSSRKWAGRAPEGFVLARCFLGERGGALLGSTDEAIAATVGRDLARVAGIHGAPVLARVARWADAMPRYAVGHRGRVGVIEAALSGHPEVVVTGAALRGVGVPDCIEQGRLAARKVMGVPDRGRVAVRATA